VVNGQLENSLRHEIETYLESRMSAMKQDISALQGLLNESLSGLFERQSDVPLEGSLSTTIAEHLRAAHERGSRAGDEVLGERGRDRDLLVELAPVDDGRVVLGGVVAGPGRVAEEDVRHADVREIDVVAAVLAEDRADCHFWPGAVAGPPAARPRIVPGETLWPDAAG